MKFDPTHDDEPRPPRNPTTPTVPTVPTESFFKKHQSVLTGVAIIAVITVIGFLVS